MTQVFVKTVTQLRVVDIVGADGATTTLSTTDEHPFFVVDRGWVRADELAIGDTLLQPDGTAATVTGSTVEVRAKGVTVYNLEVEGGHTYFVDDGTSGAAVWVHNASYVGIFKDAKGRVATAYKWVTKAHLGTGSTPSSAGRSLVAKIGGETDDAGHLIARILGGGGGARSGNIVAMLTKKNRGTLANFEKSVAKKIAAGNDAHIVVRVTYGKDSQRPLKFSYRVKFAKGPLMKLTFTN